MRGNRHREIERAKAMMCNQGTIYAFDRDGKRLKTLTNLMEQRHVTCVEAREKDSAR